MRFVEARDVEAEIEAQCDEAQESGKLPLPVYPEPTKDDLMRAFARRLSFPSYFGRNLDAFADAMRDFTYAMTGPSTIILGEHEDMQGTDTMAAVEEILAETEDQASSVFPLEVVVVRAPRA
ncbi:barstar family protein [Falsarthrobacter nasiphocae]|uniref:RNAse (Barnase) inhibitor barstar n=1 Tax=Falsarthrobacter nasiphocae TaxID=189863 RepID=A0AAE4C7V1_9MICC|nr:barstar family protein [Falsarthrobacter nasiphocae]MDR6891760.1 RNAse (barnase) inhibitor barstar [Falsarthrobacter nasiphocae]